MPIIVTWYESEKLNIHYELAEQWSWDELFAAIDEAIFLLDSVEYSVNLIIDFTETKYVPRIGIDKLNKVAHAPTMSHPNTRYLMMVGASGYINGMFRVFKRLFPKVGERYLVFKIQNELDGYLQKI